MKTLIINGSPRKNGDTAALIKKFKEHLSGEAEEISAYYGKIAPCVDCRRCHSHKGCVIRDDMDKIYADDYDILVIASPVYMHNLTGPLLSLASRFQMYYTARRFLNEPIVRRKKTAALLLSAGGDGGAEPAIESAKLIFKIMNAKFDEANAAFSLQTDTLTASEDSEALKKAGKIARRLSTAAGSL